jgi:hypothetical protein
MKPNNTKKDMFSLIKADYAIPINEPQKPEEPRESNMSAEALLFVFELMLNVRELENMEEGAALYLYLGKDKKMVIIDESGPERQIWLDKRLTHAERVSIIWHAEELFYNFKLNTICS